MIYQRKESHLISFWLCRANVTLKLAFDKCAGWRRAHMICLPDYHPQQILSKMQILMSPWLMTGFSSNTKRDRSDDLSVIVTILCTDQAEQISY